MKLLFTANRFPYPPYRGDKLKIFHLARHLSGKHELHLVTFLQDKSDLQYLPELKKIFSEIYLVPLSRWQSYRRVSGAFFSGIPFQVGYFYSRKMEEKIAELRATHNYDAVHVQHLRMAQYWADYKDIPRILDLPDAYSLYWRRRAEAGSGLSKWLAKIEQKRVFAYEQILKGYNLSLVCSREDCQYLENAHHARNVRILPNGVDLDVFTHEAHNYRQDEVILFTGNMDYAPNVDAAVYFAKDIFPLIREHIPDARFIIAGQRPVKKIRALRDTHIEVTGFVKDLSEMYRRASIVVAPLRFGAGTQNKVLEAMAMGVPVVSHEVGFTGLDIQSGEGVIREQEVHAFAGTCVALLRDADLRRQVGESGRSVVRSRFGWNVIAALLERYFREITG